MASTNPPGDGNSNELHFSPSSFATPPPPPHQAHNATREMLSPPTSLPLVPGPPSAINSAIDGHFIVQPNASYAAVRSNRDARRVNPTPNQRPPPTLDEEIVPPPTNLPLVSGTPSVINPATDDRFNVQLIESYV